MTGNTGNEDLVADYLGEAQDYLEAMNQTLLSISANGGSWSPAQINELFRSAHSFKGLSACFGFDRSNALTHQLENLLTHIRDGKIHPTEAVVRTIFTALDGNPMAG